VKAVKDWKFQGSRPMNAETGRKSGVKQKTCEKHRTEKRICGMTLETAPGDGESHLGAFRLKKVSMENNQGTC